LIGKGVENAHARRQGEAKSSEKRSSGLISDHFESIFNAICRVQSFFNGQLEKSSHPLPVGVR